MENSFKYDQIHKSFKNFIDNLLKNNVDYNNVDIDRLWTISKYTNKNSVGYTLSLKKDSSLKESDRIELNKQFMLLKQ